MYYTVTYRNLFYSTVANITPRENPWNKIFWNENNNFLQGKQEKVHLGWFEIWGNQEKSHHGREINKNYAMANLKFGENDI